MATTDVIDRSTSGSKTGLADPTQQAFLILRSAFVVAPILFGLDKFFNVMVDWPTYLAPWLDRLVPGNAQEFMYVVGRDRDRRRHRRPVGAGVRRVPGRGWLGGIIVNLLTADPLRFYDIALRDFGLLLAALALARLAAGVRQRST